MFVCKEWIAFEKFTFQSEETNTLKKLFGNIFEEKGNKKYVTFYK